MNRIKLIEYWVVAHTEEIWTDNLLTEDNIKRFLMSPERSYIRGCDFILSRPDRTLRVRTQKALVAIEVRRGNKSEIDKVSEQKRIKQKHDGLAQEKRARSVDSSPVESSKKKILIAIESEESCMVPTPFCASRVQLWSRRLLMLILVKLG